MGSDNDESPNNSQHVENKNNKDDNKLLNNFMEIKLKSQDKEFSLKPKTVSDKVNDNPVSTQVNSQASGSSSCDADGADYNIVLTKQNSLRWTKPYLKKYVEVIKAYDKTNSITALTKTFNCNRTLIYNILRYRHVILNVTGEPKRTNVSLDETIDIIRGYSCNNYSIAKLSNRFHCTQKTVENCIVDHNKYFTRYKLTNPEFDESKMVKLTDHIMTHEKRREVAKAFKLYPNTALISHLFRCRVYKSDKYSDEITIESEESEESEPRSKRKLNDFENLFVSDYQDLRLALKPLGSYAKFTNNSYALNILTQLEDHLQSMSTHLPNSNEDQSEKRVVASYSEAFNALKPIEDYAKSTNNDDAKDALSELSAYLVLGI